MPSPRRAHFSLVSAGPVQLYSTAELMRMPPPTWQIDRLVPAGGLVGLYGPPGCGKSFVALDMALAVASGIPWHGRQVERGFVIYISAEGVAGLGQRVKAWLFAHGLDAEDVDVAWLTQAVPIYADSEELEVLFHRFDELQRMPTLVIVDTLARCFDGNENEQLDMGRFIAGVDRLRHECGSTVMAVHHTNSNEGRERGSTAFRGASDTMIRLMPGIVGKGVGAASFAKAPSGVSTLTIEKQKEAENGPDAIIRLVGVGATTSARVTLEWRE